MSLTPSHYLAIDLGAESGRGMLATLSGDRMTLEEIHRFANEPVKILDTLYWDAPRLLLEVKKSISLAAHRCREQGASLNGIGVDTWGVDYGLIGSTGDLMGNPIHYRDGRTESVMERVLKHVPRETIFQETGLQFMHINTLFQLVAEKEREATRLQHAMAMLMMPDLMHYFLTGRIVSERSIASTSQLWNPRTGTWSQKLLDALEIPRPLLPDIIDPGTVIGSLRPDLTSELGLDTAPPVIASACHDTAAAVAAVPADESGLAKDETWGYLSSGTWSLMGVELQEPRITPEVLEANFTNEGGVNGTIRFLRNSMGLWILQESRREWERQGESLDYATLTQLAEKAQPLVSLIDTGAPEFFAPGDMPVRIREFCKKTGQPSPEEKGALTRCIFESLALTYRQIARQVHQLTGRRIGRLHVVGGGSRNRLLNQLTADALGADVVAGPSEATALGNALMQAAATGALPGVNHVRRVVKNSTETHTFKPRDQLREAWDTAAQKCQDWWGNPRGNPNSART